MKLRGSKSSILTAYAESLKVIIKENDVASLKAGILAVIHLMEAQAQGKEYKPIK